MEKTVHSKRLYNNPQGFSLFRSWAMLLGARVSEDPVTSGLWLQFQDEKLFVNAGDMIHFDGQRFARNSLAGEIRTYGEDALQAVYWDGSDRAANSIVAWLQELTGFGTHSKEKDLIEVLTKEGYATMLPEGWLVLRDGNISLLSQAEFNELIAD